MTEDPLDDVRRTVVSTDVAVPPPREIVLPPTGELIDLGNPDQVARALRTCRLAKTEIDGTRVLLEAAMVEQSRLAGTKTLRLDGYLATVGPDSELAWDITVLPELLAAGLPDSRYNELVKTEVTYKVDARVATQIEKANPVYAEIIGRARSRAPKRPSVKVEEK